MINAATLTDHLRHSEQDFVRSGRSMVNTQNGLDMGVSFLLFHGSREQAGHCCYHSSPPSTTYTYHRNVEIPDSDSSHIILLETVDLAEPDERAQGSFSNIL